jgi:hypothetical protein
MKQGEFGRLRGARGGISFSGPPCSLFSRLLAPSAVGGGAGGSVAGGTKPFGLGYWGDAARQYAGRPLGARGRDSTASSPRRWAAYMGIRLFGIWNKNKHKHTTAGPLRKAPGPRATAASGRMAMELVRNLYGVPSAPRRWHMEIHNMFLREGFILSSADPCLFIKGGLRVMLFVVCR